jgi:DNA gyrase inhibitor GyrI
MIDSEMVSKMVKIKVKNRRALTIAYIEYTGDYASVPWDKGIDEVITWAKTSKAGIRGKPLAIYLDDPNTTEPKKIRTRIAVPIGKPKPASGNVKTDELPSMTVAQMKFADSSDKYKDAWCEIGKWIEKNGYEGVAPPMEEWTKMPKKMEENTIIFSNILFPVKKKA